MAKSKNLNVVLVGNPNVGLTTLFNQLTGGLQHKSDTGVKEGYARKHEHANIVELPGQYSLSS